MAPRALPLRELAPIGRTVGGCLVRIVLFVVFLFIALATALFLYGRALL